MKKTALFKWIKRFREGRDDDARPGRFLTTRDDQIIERLRSLGRSDRKMTVRILADELRIGKWSGHTILTENLGPRQRDDWWTVRLLIRLCWPVSFRPEIQSQHLTPLPKILQI